MSNAFTMKLFNTYILGILSCFCLNIGTSYSNHTSPCTCPVSEMVLPPVTRDALFCQGDLSEDLSNFVTATGTLVWYDVPTGGTAIPKPIVSTQNVLDSTYFVSETDTNGNESARIPLRVRVLEPATGITQNITISSGDVLSYNVVDEFNGIGDIITWEAVDNPDVEGETLTPTQSNSIGDQLINRSSSSKIVEYQIKTASSIACGNQPSKLLVTVEPSVLVFVSNTSVIEGDSATITVQLTESLPEAIEVEVRFTGGTASDADLSMVSEIVTIPANTTQIEFGRQSIDDTADEGTETVILGIGTIRSTERISPGPDVLLTILDNEGNPSLFIPNRIVEEGNPANIDLQLTTASTTDIEIEFEFNLITASTQDFITTNQTIRIPAGTRNASLSVSTFDDIVTEGTETFEISIKQVRSGTISNPDTKGIVTITDNDFQASAAIEIPEVEGEEGTVISFPVALTASLTERITITFGVVNGTTSNSDYRNALIPVVFEPGQELAFASLETVEDLIKEDDENFTLTVLSISNPKLITNPDVTTQGIIADNDKIKISIEDARAEEGQTLTFRVDLTLPASEDLVIELEYENETTSDDDYTIQTTEIRIPAGDVSVDVQLPTVDDTEDELDEVVFIKVKTIKQGSVDDQSDVGRAIIVDNEDIPEATLEPAEASEGDILIFPVTLTAPAPFPMELTFRIDDIDTNPEDYNLLAETIQIPKGETQGEVRVEAVEDIFVEEEEQFSLTLIRIKGSVLSDIFEEALGTIKDNDTLQISIEDVTTPEGDNLVFLIKANQPVPNDVTFTVNTVDNTADTSDYDPITSTVTITSGDSIAAVSVATFTDSLEEGEEDMLLQIDTDQDGIVLLRNEAIGRIKDVPPPPLPVPPTPPEPEAYPKFFTPNNDGFNDFWQVGPTVADTVERIEVYDRYGRLLKVIDVRSQGWDGMYNGTPLPSSDYWYIVKHSDGQVVSGHMALVR